MQTGIVIIGQGICGTLLSWFLEQRGRTYWVVDDGAGNSASQISAGIMNPVSGRLREHAWQIETVLPHAVEVYTEMGAELGATLVQSTPLLDFFPSPQMRLSFFDEAGRNNPYLQTPENEHAFHQFVNDPFGYGIVSPCYTVNMPLLVGLWRKKLAAANRLIEARVDTGSKETIDIFLREHEITAEKIIFCDGAAAASGKWFGLLPFALNKGESLLVHIPELPGQYIFKRTFSLSPAGNGLFRWGASYVWRAEDAEPTKEFRLQAETQLRQFIKIPFTVEGHFAGVRPATVERRPFAGMHPVYRNWGILNGMGSKGASLAPFMARQLCTAICDGTPVQPEAALERFRNILMR